MSQLPKPATETTEPLRVAIEEDREKLNKKEALFKIISQNLLKKLNLFRSWMLTAREKQPLNTLYNKIRNDLRFDRGRFTVQGTFAGFIPLLLTYESRHRILHKKSSLFTIKRFFYTYCALKVKDFHFFHETSSYFVYAKIYKSGKNFCRTMQVCISDMMLGVTLQWTTPHPGGSGSNTSKYFMLQKPEA